MCSLDDLVVLFAGEPAEGGGFMSAPYPTVGLAAEICRRTCPADLAALFGTVYGEMPMDGVDGFAVEVLTGGWMRWQATLTAVGG